MRGVAATIFQIERPKMSLRPSLFDSHAIQTSGLVADDESDLTGWFTVKVAFGGQLVTRPDDERRGVEGGESVDTEVDRYVDAGYHALIFAVVGESAALWTIGVSEYRAAFKPFVAARQESNFTIATPLARRPDSGPGAEAADLLAAELSEVWRAQVTYVDMPVPTFVDDRGTAVGGIEILDEGEDVAAAIDALPTVTTVPAVGVYGQARTLIATALGVPADRVALAVTVT